MAKMAEIMSLIRGEKINAIAGYKLEFISDYDISETVYTDGRKEKILLPKSNVLYYGLSGGDWVCVRPSGTEPKLKVYVSASAGSSDEAAKKANTILESMRKYL
jgi:phosphoglucomutase